MTEAQRKAILRKRFGSLDAFYRLHGRHKLAIRNGRTRKRSTVDLFETFGINLELTDNFIREDESCKNINPAEIARHVQRVTEDPENVMVLLDIDTKRCKWKIRTQKVGCGEQSVIDGITVGAYNRGCLSAQVRGDIRAHMKGVVGG